MNESTTTWSVWSFSDVICCSVAATAASAAVSAAAASAAATWAASAASSWACTSALRSVSDELTSVTPARRISSGAITVPVVPPSVPAPGSSWAGAAAVGAGASIGTAATTAAVVAAAIRRRTDRDRTVTWRFPSCCESETGM